MKNRRPMLIALGLGCVLLPVLLVMCSAISLFGWRAYLTSQPHLSSALANRLLQIAREQDPSAEIISFGLACTIAEGTACELGGQPLPGDLIAQLMTELKLRHAANSESNTVEVACRQDFGNWFASLVCEWDRGSGWEPLPIP